MQYLTTRRDSLMRRVTLSKLAQVLSNRRIPNKLMSLTCNPRRKYFMSFFFMETHIVLMA